MSVRASGRRKVTLRAWRGVSGRRTAIQRHSAGIGLDAKATTLYDSGQKSLRGVRSWRAVERRISTAYPQGTVQRVLLHSPLPVRVSWQSEHNGIQFDSTNRSAGKSISFLM